MSTTGEAGHQCTGFGQAHHVKGLILNYWYTINIRNQVTDVKTFAIISQSNSNYTQLLVCIAIKEGKVKDNNSRSRPRLILNRLYQARIVTSIKYREPM